MLSMRDLLDYCDLNQEEIEAIAEHEHIPLTVAAGISEALVDNPAGVVALHQMVLENLIQAIEHGDAEHVAELQLTYNHLCRHHPLPASPEQH